MNENQSVAVLAPLAAFLLPAAFASGLRAQDPDLVRRTEAIVAEVKAERAPDRRTVVFDVEVAADGDRVVLRGWIHDAALETFLLGRCVDALGEGKVEDELEALPQASLGERTHGLVRVSVANLRIRPGHARELASQLLLGMPLRILASEGDWLYVQGPNGYLGWTIDRVQRMTADEMGEWKSRPRLFVTATFAEVRSEPDAEARPVSDVVAGCVLGLEEHTNGWYRVRYPDGRTGWLVERAARPLEEWLREVAATPKSIVTTARRFFGVPYLWGGTSTKAMDCSGFTSTVYWLNGVVLARDASQQARTGRPVAIGEGMSEVRAGDLLFFGTPATGARRERITHVGISLGRNRFIHCSRDVHENSFDPADEDYSASLRARLLHVRRVLGAGAETGVYRLRDLPHYE